MTQKAQLKYGIPDVELACTKGGTINPSTFVGHQLVVLFLPTDELLAVRELNEFASYGSELTDGDAWLIAILETETPPPQILSRRQLVACDGDGFAWAAFQRLLGQKANLERESGAVYLFARGGGLQRMWLGIGHADEVIGELHLPSSW